MQAQMDSPQTGCLQRQSNGGGGIRM